jgi:hypothetical protein
MEDLASKFDKLLNTVDKSDDEKHGDDDDDDEEIIKLLQGLNPKNRFIASCEENKCFLLKSLDQEG